MKKVSLQNMQTVLHEKFADLLPFIQSLPSNFEKGEGKVIYKGRNELREFQYKGYDLVVKSFRKPNLINQIAYGTFRSSKAQRSYEYAEMFLKAGIGTPQPVGYITERKGVLLQHSYYVCLKSACPYTFNDLLTRDFPRFEEIIQAVAKTTAHIHEKGYLHKDYSAGNILFRDDTKEIQVEIIDLNRMKFGKVGLEKACKNFERLPQTGRILPLMAQTYAFFRGFTAHDCYKRMKRYMYTVE